MLLIIWAKNGNFFQKCTDLTAWTMTYIQLAALGNICDTGGSKPSQIPLLSYLGLHVFYNLSHLNIFEDNIYETPEARFALLVFF